MTAIVSEPASPLKPRSTHGLKMPFKCVKDPEFSEIEPSSRPTVTCSELSTDALLAVTSRGEGIVAFCTSITASLSLRQTFPMAPASSMKAAPGTKILPITM